MESKNEQEEMPEDIFFEERLKNPEGDRQVPIDKLPLPMQKPLQLARVFKGNDIEVDMI